MITINWIGIVCLWLMSNIVFIAGWMIGHDKGYAKARKEWSK